MKFPLFYENAFNTIKTLDAGMLKTDPRGWMQLVEALPGPHVITPFCTVASEKHWKGEMEGKEHFVEMKN